MEVQTVSQPQVLLDHRALEAEVGVMNSANLGVRTAEGDVVQLSFSNEFNFSGSKSETRQDGAVTQEISTTAQAAARYSLAIQGDLNEDELAAIKELAGKVEPIATEFFQSGKFNVDKAVNSLGSSLGTLEEIALKLEQTITATFSVQQTQVTQPPPPPSGGVPKDAPELKAANVDASQLLQGPEGKNFLNYPKVKDITELALSVIDSEFPARGAEVFGSKAIVRSLRDLMQFLRDRITSSLEGVNSAETQPESPSESQADSAESSEPAETQNLVEA